MKQKQPFPVIGFVSIISILWGMVVLGNFFTEIGIYLDTSKIIQLICFIIFLVIVIYFRRKKQLPVNDGKTIALYMENAIDRPVTVNLFNKTKTNFSPEYDLHYSCHVPDMEWSKAVDFLRSGEKIKSLKILTLTKCPVNAFSITLLDLLPDKYVELPKVVEYDQVLHLVDKITPEMTFRFKLWARQQVLFVFEMEEEFDKRLLQPKNE